MRGPRLHKAFGAISRLFRPLGWTPSRMNPGLGNTVKSVVAEADDAAEFIFANGLALGAVCVFAYDER